MSRRGIRRSSLLAAAVVVALSLLPGCGMLQEQTGDFKLTADFRRGTGLYPGSPVRVLGIDVGRITDVKNRDGYVRVKMRLDDDVRLPSAVRATIVPLTLLGERYVQLGPAYTRGARLRSGAHIPMRRTAVPTEIDELLRSLQDYIGSIDPDRAGDLVTDLADVLDGRGADLNRLLENAAGTLELLADKGDELHDVVRSLGDLSETLRGRTADIETLIRNYDLVAEVLVANKGDLDATITELDRASTELARFIADHEDPLREDVDVLTQSAQTVAANTEEMRLTLRATVRLFEAAGRAFDERMRSLNTNNQLAPDMASAVTAGRLRDRVAGLCRRLGVAVCSDATSPLLNGLAGALPGILGSLASGEPPAPPKLPTKQPAPAPAPKTPAPRIPTLDELVAALADQITQDLRPDQVELLRELDPAKIAGLLSVDPALLQVLPKLDEAQLTLVRDAAPEDIDKVLLELTNQLIPPARRLEPTLPPRSTTTTRPGDDGLGGLENPITEVLGDLLGGV